MKMRFDALVTETSQRLYGLAALIELVYQAAPEVELRERDALKELANQGSWEYGEYRVEDEFLDIKFGYWLPKSAAYCVIILLGSIIETQLLAYATRVGEQTGSAFDRKHFRFAILDNAAAYIKRVSGSDLTKNKRWGVLKDLQALRNIIVHRAGRPDENEKDQLKEIRERRPGISLDENPSTIKGDPELDLTIHSCRYFAREVEEFFKGLFTDAGLPVRSGLWPNIQSGLP